MSKRTRRVTRPPLRRILETVPAEDPERAGSWALHVLECGHKIPVPQAHKQGAPVTRVCVECWHGEPATTSSVPERSQISRGQRVRSTLTNRYGTAVSVRKDSVGVIWDGWPGTIQVDRDYVAPVSSK